LSAQKLSGEVSFTFVEPKITVRVPFGMQKPSANSQSAPLVKFLTGQAIGFPFGPSVSGFVQTPVVLLQPPSPTLALPLVVPSLPPTQVSETDWSLKMMFFHAEAEAVVKLDRPMAARERRRLLEVAAQLVCL
jgi:hypothetical protein